MGACKMASVPLWTVWIALVVIQFGFGAYGVIVAKFAKNNKADPLVFSLIRDAFCFPVLLLAALIAEKKVQTPSYRDLPVFCILGLTGMFGNQFLYILGVYYTTADIASIFQPAIPVWTSLIAILFRIEPFPPLKKLRGWSKILGILLAAVGAAITMTTKWLNKKNSSDSKMHTEILGYIFLLGNTLSMAIYVLLQKKFIFNNSDSCWNNLPVNVTAWSYGFGTIFMGLASLYYVNQPEKFHIPAETIFPLIYAVFVASALCYLLISWCNMQISSSLVTATWPLQVFFCVVLAYFILGETMYPLEIVGSFLIIIGLLGVVWANYAEEKEISVPEGYQYVSDEDEFVSGKSPEKIN